MVIDTSQNVPLLIYYSIRLLVLAFGVIEIYSIAIEPLKIGE